LKKHNGVNAKSVDFIRSKSAEVKTAKKKKTQRNSSKKKSSKDRNKDGTFKKGHKLSRTKRDRQNPKRRKRSDDKSKRSRKKTKTSRSGIGGRDKTVRIRTKATKAEKLASDAILAETLAERREVERSLASSRAIPRTSGEEALVTRILDKAIETATTAGSRGFRKVIGDLEKRATDAVLGRISRFIRDEL